MCSRCEFLEEENLYLKKLIANDSWRAPDFLKLTEQEEKVLAHLVRFGRASKEALIVASRTRSCTRDPYDYEEHGIAVVISKIRKKLKPHDLHIQTEHHRGYCLPALTFEFLSKYKQEASHAG